MGRHRAARVQAARVQAVRMQAAGFDQPKVPEMMVPVSINQLGDKVNLAASIPAERGAAQYLGVYTKSMLLRRSSVKSKHGERVGHYEQVSNPNKQIWWDGDASVWIVGDKSTNGDKSAGIIGMEAQVSTPELARAADTLAAGAAEGMYVFLLGDSLDTWWSARREFVRLTGPTPVLPEWAFGIWFTWWHAYTEAEAKAEILRWRTDKLPLDVSAQTLSSFFGAFGAWLAALSDSASSR